MSKPEGSSQERSLTQEDEKQLERERVLSGMAGLYPELWGPISEERKKEILAKAADEISDAVRVGDIDRASGELYPLKKICGESEGEPREYVPGTKPETKTGKEIRALLTEQDWERVMKRINNRIGGEIGNFLLASEVREFDPVRFDREVKDIDGIIDKVIDALKSGRVVFPWYTIDDAYGIKKLSPERFEEIVFTEEMLDRAIKELKEENEGTPNLYQLYDNNLVVEVFGREILSKVGFREEDLEKIVHRTKESNCPTCEARAIGYHNQLIPDGGKKATMPRKRWDIVLDDLKKTLTFRADAQFFMDANTFKHVVVEE